MPLTLLDQALPYLPRITAKLQATYHFSRGVEAADVVQDIAIRLLSMLPIARPDLESYLPKYVKGICSNRARDHWRAWVRYEPRHCPHEEELHASKERTPLSQIVSRETREEILSRLTAEQIEVVGLVEEGYTFAEIAQKLGIGQAAVRMRLHAARKRVSPVAA